jgi:hypothetical protein
MGAFVSGLNSIIPDLNRQRDTYNSPGPCTPMVRVISMSAVPEGPVITTAALAFFISCIVLDNDGRRPDLADTAIWISESSGTCNELPSPSMPDRKLIVL